MSSKRLIQQALAVLRTLPGRLLLLCAGLLIVLGAWQRVAALPDIVDTFRKVVVLAFGTSVTWIAIRAIWRGRRRWLWAVRRKLILSYVFFGVFPVALIVVFVLVGGWILYTETATYLFQTGYQKVVEDVALVAKTAADEIGQNPASAADVLAREYQSQKESYSTIALAVLSPTRAGGFDVVTAGKWAHLPAPSFVPSWILDDGAVFTKTLGLVRGNGADGQLVIRAVRPTSDGRTFVVVDLPVDSIITKLQDSTGTRIDGITLASAAGTASPIVVANRAATAKDDPVVASAHTTVRPFRYTVAWMDFSGWTNKESGRASISLEAPALKIYEQISESGAGDISSALRRTKVSAIIVALAGLFLIILLSAFVQGVALARRITSAVHYLFHGTARIGQGDFGHRIPIGSNDQLGDLAGSFNNMSASIEHLRHVERDKLRLDEELQIARRIQRSLLPNAVPQMTGLSIADLCEPAMEVGGDYYDFFVLGPRQLGVLVADVSGKGTSAALYMAELKGLMLALSRSHRSPRALLVELNDLLADHLDNRSFITMTYAVIDLEAGTLTCARAGHTPLLVVSGGESHVVVPSGMVLGLRLPGAGTRFSELLEEHTQPLTAGDVIVLYTDGITEAMTADGDLFGDEALSRVVLANQDLDAAGIRERILRDVRAFVGDAEPHDDMTMVVLKLKEPA